MVPQWVVIITAIGSVLAALIVQTFVRVEVSRRGGSLLREWGLGLLSFFLTVVATWALYFIVGIVATGVAHG